jgi:uncharacterized protein YndB with AHSA1/START domain
MQRAFEVRRRRVLPAAPEQVWEALTVHSAGWLWPIEYEPRVGGAERGLTSAGGTVTAWEPPHRFETSARGADGWRNELRYELAPHREGTLMSSRHLGTLPPEEYDLQYDACLRHTDLYQHTLAAYLASFAGRAAAHVELDVPGSLAQVRAALGLGATAATGDRARLPSGREGTVDLLTEEWIGVRTDDALVRVLGREAWGWPNAISLHLFAPGADALQARRAWSDWLSPAVASGAVG